MTTDHLDDRLIFRAALIEEAQARAGEHPDLDTLVEYLTDALDAETVERVRDHLTACKECVTAVLDLEPLLTPDEAGDKVADLEIEIAWRDLRSRLEVPGERVPERSNRWAVVIAASLLAATVGLSLWVGQLSKNTANLKEQVAWLAEPQPNQPVFYVDELTRSSNQKPVEILVPSGAKTFVLILSVSGLAVEKDYELRFIDPAGEEILRASGLRATGTSGLRLGLSRDALPAGTYSIQLWARDQGRPKKVDEFRRRFSYPRRP